MHITIETKKLQSILELVSRISTKHVTLPVLQCVLLEVVHGVFKIKATNLEIGIEATCPAHVEEEGVIAIPAHIFLQTINFIKQSSITLLVEDGILHVETPTSKTEIKSIDATDFPSIPIVTGEPILIQGNTFAYGIKSVAFTASQSSIKPELGSVYIFQKKEHTLTFVATDSFRLMEKVVTQKNISFKESILIPYKNAIELARVVDGVSEQVTLLVGDNQCALIYGDIYITSRLVSGAFPDYEQIIPKEYKTNAIILSGDLAQTLKKTGVFLNKFMQLTMTISEGACTFSAQSNDTGTTTESVKAQTEGEDITLSFNQRYVSDVVPHIHEDSIVLKCGGVGRPMVIEHVHDKSLRYLVMPMNK